MKQKRIIAAGSICVDILPKIKSEKVSRLDECIPPGGMAEADEAAIHLGGSVGNTGLALHALGADVAMLGKIGKDTWGETILSILEEHDCAEHMIVDEDVSTSYTLVLAVPGLDRCFIHHTGANDTYCFDDIKDSSLEGASLFHFGYPPVMKRIYENGGEELMRILRKMKDKGISTSVDMTLINDKTAGASVNWKEFLGTMLPYVDLFLPSIEELAYFLDKDMYIGWQNMPHDEELTAIIPLEDVHSLAKQCLDMGAKVVMVKCGVKGVYLLTADEEAMKTITCMEPEQAVQWANVDAFVPSFKPDRIASASAAGDTCIAGFLHAVTSGYDWKKSLEYAAATGACCVETYDAISGLLPFDKLEERIQKGWERNQF